MSRIQELKGLSPQQRAESLSQCFQNNYKFFSGKYPIVAKLMHAGPAPFHIDVTDDFLTISNTETGELCHPEVGLDRFAEALGDWTNTAWIDLIEGNIHRYAEHGKYSQYPEQFQKAMFGKFPALLQRMQERKINLPVLPNGKRFSNPTIFIGVFHGLHIEHYLGRTQLRNVAFVEPDPARFILSCYFLDYQSMEKRFGELLLHVGEGVPDSIAERFFEKSGVTGAVWVRVLPGYASDQVEPLIRKFRLRWRRPYDVWVPAERQIQGFRNVVKNIEAGSKMLAKKLALSPQSRIAVVGAGPSLANDLGWLCQHQDQFVIFSAHSAVSALQKAGINPDFQFSLDTYDYDQKIFDRLQLDKSIPIVTVVSDMPDKFQAFSKVLRLSESCGVYPVAFNVSVPFLAPTTGNMALAFACWCQPKEVYLFGLDFGFRQAAQTHVGGAVDDAENGRKGTLGSGHLPVEANFGGSDVVTQSYFNLARIVAQRPIERVGDQVVVSNCSDGALIEGARPCRSDEIELKEYDKSEDVDSICSMFMSLEEGVHWNPLPLDACSQWNAYKKSILRTLKLKKYNWLKFATKLDEFKDEVSAGLPRKIMRDRDLRVEPYLGVVNLLLIAWYRILCLTNTEQESQQVYEAGYTVIAKLIEDMHWDDV